MSRTITTASLNAINAAQTAAVFLVLLTIDHDDLAAPIRVCSNSTDIVSRGNTFVAFPFDISLPDDAENGAPRARLSIDNVDRSIVQAIRTITSSPSILIEIVRSADLATVEASFVDFRMTNIAYDAQVVTADLTVEDYTAEPFPAGQFTPSLFPGLFQ